MGNRQYFLATYTVIIISMLIAVSYAGKTVDMDKKMKTFFSKEKVTIIITDSGLGGLSVAAEIEKKFRENHPFREVELIFVNALAHKQYLYNQMKTTEEKALVFNGALDGMTDKFRPDMILIACNTLSVIFDQTVYSKREPIPVVGIAEFGINLINENVKDSPDDQVVILGTPTTIGQNAHKSGLVEKGIGPNRIVNQSCPMLESEIQNNPSSDMVAAMIEMFAEEALEKVEQQSGTLNIGLCCTHYTYSVPLFKDIFSRVSGRNVKVLDPNQVMSAYIFENSNSERFKTTKITARVVSQVELIPEDIKAIAGMLKPVSPAFARALKKYELMKTMFLF